MATAGSELLIGVLYVVEAAAWVVLFGAFGASLYLLTIRGGLK
jgi:hypothetical protein